MRKDDELRERSSAPRPRASVRSDSNAASSGSDAPTHEPLSNALPNDIEFSGERKRVRCNEGLDRPFGRENVRRRHKRQSRMRGSLDGLLARTN